MRILIYSYNYHPEPIGIAPLMTDLAEGLTHRGHEVRVLTAMPWYPQGEIYPEYRGKLFCTEERNGVKIQRCYIWSRIERNVRNRALMELSFMSLSFFQGLGWSPDIILLTVPGLPVCVPAAMLSKLYGKPVILNLQDILPDAAVHVGLISNPKLISILEELEKFAYQTATKITVIADGFSKHIQEKGVPKEKIVEIPNWVDIDFIKPLCRENNYLRREYGLEGKFVVMYSGNIALTQPLETAIAAAKLLEDKQDIVIVIVGEKKALKRLEKIRQQYNVDNVLLVPFQPREKLPQMLAAADVGLAIQKKNVIHFNMPSKIQVLLASGRPIIASVPLRGTAARAIERSGGGLVIPPEDSEALAKAIEQLYSAPHQVKALGARGRQFAETEYGYELALDRYEQLFAQTTGISL